MHTFHHRETGVTIMHEGNHVGHAILRVPVVVAKQPEVKHDRSHEYRVPSSALASFGWDAGVAESIDLIRDLRRPTGTEENRVYNEAVLTVLSELERLRKIGR